MSGWRTYRIAELGRVVTGKTPPSSQPELFDGTIPFITPSDMSFDHRHISTERSVSADWDSKQRTLLPEGAVCVVCIGATIGKICMSGKPSQTNQQINSVIVDQARFDQGFVYYGLRTKAVELMARAAGAATPIINKTAFSEVEIDAPSLETQRRIASILGAYDDLIEVNRRRIAVLEEMARGLFEEWFVRYRFPGYEAVPILDTQDGPLPEGWRQAVLGDLVEQRRDTTDAGEHLNERAYVPIECIARRSLALDDLRPWNEAQSSLQLFSKGDILFGAMRAYFHKVAPAPLDGVTRSTCFVLRPRSSSLTAYSLQVLFRDETVAYASTHSKGSTIPYAQWAGVLERMPCVFPDEQTLQRFQLLVQPMVDLIISTWFQVRNLVTSRDLLLPRLISGQLSVAEAERELEEVA